MGSSIREITTASVARWRKRCCPTGTPKPARNRSANVLLREDLPQGDHVYLAPDLMARPAPMWSYGNIDRATQESRWPSGDHRQEGDRGIARGERDLGSPSIADIAPTLLATQGLVAVNIDGRPISLIAQDAGILDEDGYTASVEATCCGRRDARGAGRDRATSARPWLHRVMERREMPAGRSLRWFAGKLRPTDPTAPPIALTPATSDRSSPIFLIGCQRSGTSLLRRIVDSHPMIACPPETSFILPLVQVLHDRRSGRGFEAMGY